MTEYTFSKDAQPMVDYIRANVPPPDHYPSPDDSSEGTFKPLRFECGKCPMGLLPEATQREPYDLGHFGHPLQGEVWPEELIAAIDPFYKSWDTWACSVTAYEAVWPEGMKEEITT